MEASLAKHQNKAILNLLKAAVTFGIFYYLYVKGMLDLTRVKFVFTNPATVAVSFFCLLAAALAGVIRWRMLVLGQMLRISWAEALRLTMIGLFFNTALPGAVSGDFVKGYYIVRKQPDGRGRIRAFASLLMDRLLGLSALVFISFFVMVLNLDTMLSSTTLKSLCGLIALLWAGVVGFYAFVLIEWSFSKKIPLLLKKLPAGEHVSKLFEAVKAYESCRTYIIKGLVISIAIHCTLIGVFIILAKTLGDFESVPASKFFFLAPLGLLVTAIPVAPAGLGTGHAAFAWLFTQVGSRHGADLFTAYVSFQILISLIGGLFYLMSDRTAFPAALSDGAHHGN